MNMHDNKKGSQFVLSYELLTLLRWLADHDEDKLKKIIGKALTSGLQEELNKLDYTDEATLMDDMQHSITYFLGLLESLLVESMTERIQQKTQYQDLIPAVDHIDTTVCDDHTVRHSLEKATEKMEHDPTANAKELLFEELLRRWKPVDKEIQN